MIIRSKEDKTVKPWPNGVYLRLLLAQSRVHLRRLAMTCAYFGRDQIFTQVEASFSPFGHPTQVNASWVTPSINLLLANEVQEKSALKWVFLRLACTCEETCLSVWPPNASLYSSSACHCLRLLASPFSQGLKIQPSVHIRLLKPCVPILSNDHRCWFTDGREFCH